MIKIVFYLLVTLLAATQSYASITVLDDDGREITLQKPAQRIVSLSPAETEMLFAAGGEGHVVGVIRYSDFPLAAKRLPVVGDAIGLDLERIVSLQPDLIVVWREGSNKQHIEKLRSLGIPLFFGQPAHLDDIPGAITMLGRLMGTETVANPAAALLRTRLDDLKKRHSASSPVRVFYQVWDQPLYTLNGQHIVSDAIQICGGVNVFAGLTAISPIVDTESVLRMDPEAIVGTSEDGNEKSPDESGLKMWRQFGGMTAVRRHNLFLVDGNLINRAGPRMINGAAALCEKLDQARTHRRD